VEAVNGQSSDVPVVIRPGTAADADVAAALHADLISEGFLARLGPRFLRQLYRCIAAGSDSFLLIAESAQAEESGNAGSGPGGDRPIAGFLAGALDLGALYRRFAFRHGLAATLGSLPQLLGAVPQVLETLRHGTGAATEAGAELLSVAVDPRWQGRHVGALLVDGFHHELEGRAVGLSQVVVGADNDSAVALYSRAGYTTVRSFELHRGTTSLLMHRTG
jgi:ribosomal protein S18 acetylase RimI-like enzyme